MHGRIFRHRDVPGATRSSGRVHRLSCCPQDRIYFASQAGIITVIDGRSDTLKVLAQNSLDEKVTATPALVEKAIYIRTDKHLFAFANK